MLALSSPGVRAVRADPGLVSELAPGPSCSAESADATDAVLRAALEQARLRAGERAAARTQAGEQEPVALNNRGYNYGPPDDPLHAIREILAEQR
jgi:hypothetical protein